MHDKYIYYSGHGVNGAIIGKGKDERLILGFMGLIGELNHLLDKLEELESQLAYECECNKQFVECQNRLEVYKAKNQQLKEQLAEYEAIKTKYKTIFLDRFVDAKVEDARIWKEEYDKLKQQLHDLPKKIVGEITNELSNNTSLYFEIRESTSAHCPNKEYEWFNYVRFRNYINTILKKYGEKI